MSAPQVAPYLDLWLSGPIEQRHVCDRSELYTRQLQRVDAQRLVCRDPKLHVPSGFSRGQLQLHRLVAEGSALYLDVRIASCPAQRRDRKSTRLNSSHEWISYAVFC